MTAIIKTTNNSVAKEVEKRKPLCTVGVMEIGATTMKSSLGFFKKLKIELSFDPAITLSGILFKENKTLI